MARRFEAPRSKSAGLRYLISSATAGLCLVGQPVFANGWVQPEGALFARTSLALEDHGPFSARRADAYLEYGVTDTWTVSGKFESVNFDASNAFDSDGVRVALRRSLWRSDFWSSAISLGYVEGAAIGGFRGCESRGGEIAFGAGQSGTLGEDTYFIGLTLGHRNHEDNCQTNRLEFVMGVSDDDGFNYTTQYWSERGDNGNSDKIEFMVSRNFQSIELGVAARREIGGEFEEQALVFSLAYRN